MAIIGPSGGPLKTAGWQGKRCRSEGPGPLGSRLASKGLSARQIADAMGHKKTSTTEIYIQRFNGPQADERIREAISR